MKILICDDHALFRDGLGLVLERLEPGAELVESSDSQGALDLVAADEGFDLVLLDLNMPGMDGLTALRRLRTDHPAVPVVIVSASENPNEVRTALDVGASGFIPKSSSSNVLLSALRLVLDGGVYVPPVALDAQPGVDSRRRDRAGELTPRQLEVLSLMARGLTNREICGVLGIAEGTVKTHIAAIFEALEVTNRTEAAVAMRDLGLKAPGEE
jgi:DNA-binding NarL/FixJ family response regulator